MNFYFDSPRLKMGGPARFLVRFVSYIVYGMLMAAMSVLVFAELRWMQSLGIFIALFLLDRLLHLNEAEKKFSYLSSAEARVNLESYLAPAVMGVLEKASEKAAFIGGDVCLWAARQSLEKAKIKKKLVQKGSWKKILSRINQELKDDRRRRSRKEIWSSIERIVKKAGNIAWEKGKDFVVIEDLAAALKLI